MGIIPSWALRLSPRQPPVGLDDLAMMLEIDLALGRRADFLDRLNRALWAASKMSAPPADLPSPTKRGMKGSTGSRRPKAPPEPPASPARERNRLQAAPDQREQHSQHL